MKTRLFLVTVLVFALALLSVWAVGAQEPQPPRPGPAIPTPELFLWKGPGWEGKPAPFARLAAEGPGVEAASIPLGRPGLSFRYVQTFGVTQEPFIETNDHFYWVEGVGAVGNAIWIADTLAHRVLKFDAGGNFIRKIGKAGVIDFTGTALARITDVAEDGSGNVWVVDAEASHVVKYDSNGQIVAELGQAWNPGSSNDRFENPISIAFDGSGNIYVSDSGYWGGNYGNNRVQIFNSSGNHIATIGGTPCGKGNTQLCWPRHIAIYGNLLYIADADNHRVQIFNISNPNAPSYVATLGQTGSPGSGNNQFSTPQGVAVDANYIYVADTENHRVQVFRRDTRVYVATIGGSYGTGNNQFKYPTDVAVDAAGNLYVADYGNKRVQQFNSNRAYQRTYGTTGDSYVETDDRFYYPEGVAVGPDGSIYIAEGLGHRLVKLNAAGVPQWTVGEAGQPGDDNAHFGSLLDVAVGPDGRIYTVESWGSAPYMPGGNHRMQIFNPDGSYYGGFGGYGDGNYQFDIPYGIGFDRHGNLYIADLGNHRVQIYNSQFAYVATLGRTGQSGSDNAHFNHPFDVAVDKDGYIYVADSGNHRVQVFDSNRQYVRTIGGGGTGNDFGRFSGWGPHHLAVDSQGRLYVVDSGNSRVQVFDNFANGNAYLTTIGGAGGTEPGRFSNVLGIAIGPDDSVYTSEIHNNHRIQKFAPGVPGWRQVNINGFGERNTDVRTLNVFNGYMYAGTWSAQIWRTADGQTWSQVTPSNWPTSTAVFDTKPFGSYLYVGTAPDNGGEIWRTNGTIWEQVVSAGFGITQNYGINALAVFSDVLYAATSNYDGVLQVYRSDSGNSGTWAAVVTDGFGSDGVWQDVTMDVYNGYLYLGLARSGVAELWRTADGTTWTSVFTNGLAPNNTHVSAMAEFNGAFYIGLRNVVAGGEVWRSQDGINWTPVITRGLGLQSNSRPYGLIVFDGRLYLVFSNLVTGAEVWRSADGTTWERVADAGWGDVNNGFVDYFDKGATVFNNRLYIGTINWANGGEVWKKTVTADFTASPTIGAPGTTVTFTNLAGGDVVTATWNFGDGSPPRVSNAATVTHTYATPGVYTVTLTVEDGVDSDVKTRPAYIRIAHRIFLPLVMRNYNPLIALYDDFNYAGFNGHYNPLKWQFWGDSDYFSMKQQGGRMVLTSTVNAPEERDTVLVANMPLYRTLNQVQRLQAKLMFSPGTQRWAPKIQIVAEDVGTPGRNWWTSCDLFTWGFGCGIASSTGHEWGVSSSQPIQAGQWYDARIEIDPQTVRICFYLNNVLLGCRIPNDANALKTTTNFTARIGAWNGEANPTGTLYFDDVYLTPAGP